MIVLLIKVFIKFCLTNASLCFKKKQKQRQLQIEEIFQKTFEDISVQYEKNHRQVSTNLSDLEIKVKGKAK